MATRDNQQDAFAGMGGNKLKYNVDDALIQEMLKSINIVDTLQSEYNIILEEGNNGWWQCCCPLPGHRDTNPSFGVNPTLGIFNCFSCNRGGSTLKFIQIMDGCSFAEAIVRLSELSGVDVNGEGSSQISRAVRGIKAMTEEYLNRHAETQLPGGMSEVQFMRMLADRLYDWQEKTNQDSEEINWIDSVYADADNFLWELNQKGLNALWNKLSVRFQERKNNYRNRMGINNVA